MQVYGLTTLAEFLDDFVVYRSLEPCDPRLPRPARAGAGGLPRKSDAAYARSVAGLLAAAQAVVQPGAGLERLLYVGDTRLLDSTAFHNLKAETGWAGWAFIAGEDRDAPAALGREDDLFVANRWGALAEFLAFLGEQRFGLGAGTAVVIDLDKTALAARGRNDRLIDQARLAAVRQTVAAAVGDSVHSARFEAAYAELNQPRHHTFTADNQDYVTYICLMAGAGLYDLAALLDDLAAGRLTSFAQFLERVDGRIAAADEGVAAIHRQVAANVRRGDPTPFKAFRRNEYLATVARMGCLAEPLPADEALAGEIVITQEVRELALHLRARGALLFGLTDKPDEAALPTPEQAARGGLPLHRVPTHAVGDSLGLQR